MSYREKNRTKNNPYFFAAGLFAAVLTLSGCASDLNRVWKSPGTAPSSAVPWTPTPETMPKSTSKSPQIALPEDILKAEQSLSLLNIVDIALRNNPESTAAWAQARSAAAAYESNKGSYYPQLGASAGTSYIRGHRDDGETSYSQRDSLGALELDWLIFDFGGREAALDEAREALIAADWSHNTIIQNIVFEVEKAYYNYVTAKVLLEAQQATYKEAQTNMEASKDRHPSSLLLP